MKTQPIYINEFPGMNNVQRQAQIKTVLNMNVTEDKKLEKREGFSLYLALPGAHSLISDGINMFCIATGSASLESLYRITGGAKTEIGAVTGKGFPFTYVVMPDRIFFSSRAFHGIYVYATDSIRAWGVQYSDDRESFDASLNSEELLTLNVGPPPFLENLVWIGGRIWGTCGKRVYYNDPPFAYEMFRPDTYLEFDVEMTGIAYTSMGIFFGSEVATYFGEGYDPHNMAFVRTAEGMLQGTVKYMDSFRNVNNVPFWTSPNGIFVGVNSRVVPLTKEKIRFVGHGLGAAYAGLQNGVMRYFSNFQLPEGDTSSASDCVTVDIVKRGTLGE